MVLADDTFIKTSFWWKKMPRLLPVLFSKLCVEEMILQSIVSEKLRERNIRERDEAIKQVL